MLIAESDRNENPDLLKTVEKSNILKEWLVDYVGEQFKTELNRAEVEHNKIIAWNGDVTVEMIVECMAKDFPEFLMAVAEENFIRGYRQAFIDIEIGKEIADAEQENA